ncbi:hypothetical protein E4U26_000296 [Claviceps purpurea]|nr:hypothetical protein E4U26_000296 [Claviceps purpurea]
MNLNFFFSNSLHLLAYKSTVIFNNHIPPTFSSPSATLSVMEFHATPTTLPCLSILSVARLPDSRFSWKSRQST